MRPPVLLLLGLLFVAGSAWGEDDSPSAPPTPEESAEVRSRLRRSAPRTRRG